MEQRKRKRVLGIVGSPRKGGNTDILVDEILKGAQEAGALVEKVMLADLDIKACLACYTCRTAGQCVQDDDMKDLLEKMGSSQVWVLGTPVYWWGPSAQLKTFVDRWFSRAGGEETKVFFQGRRVILAVPMGDTDPKTGRHVVGMFTDALEYVGAELFACILAPGVYEMGDMDQQDEILKEARQTGRNAVG